MVVQHPVQQTCPKLVLVIHLEEALGVTQRRNQVQQGLEQDMQEEDVIQTGVTLQEVVEEVQMQMVQRLGRVQLSKVEMVELVQTLIRRLQLQHRPVLVVIMEEVEVVAHTIMELVELLDRIHREGERVRYHYVIADYLCRVTGGELAAASDADAVRWVERAEWNSHSALRLDPITVRVVEAGWQKAMQLREGR